MTTELQLTSVNFAGKSEYKRFKESLDNLYSNAINTTVGDSSISSSRAQDRLKSKRGIKEL